MYQGHARVRPIKVRQRDDDLEVDVLRVVAYRGVCPCGWESPSWSSYNEARRDVLSHKRREHGHRG